MSIVDEEKTRKNIEEIHHREEEDLVQLLAQKNNIPYIDLTSVGIDTDALRIIDEQDARADEVAGFKLVGDKLHLAVRSPERESTQNRIATLADKGYEVFAYMTSSTSLKKAWDHYADISLASSSRGSFLDISESALQEISSRVSSADDVRTLFQEANEENASHRISRLIEIIFGSAVALKVSDVHIEAQEETARLRFRLDGVLQDIILFDHETYRMIMSRLKLISGLKLTQTQDAQDGRFTINFKGQQIEIRTSVIPGGYGEAIVMRLLNPDNISVGLQDLGIEPKLLAILESEIKKPNGLILTTGPTGSGKTTTLYSFLKEVYTPEIKILTIEDPIEYHVEGITQTQVDHEKGYDFLSGLRAALRQDPDVIMVGEIRDSETANIAVNASLTGHLVLSTLHTNNAAGAIPRLLDLKLKPGILAAALSVSIAQRLVRKLCVHCKVQAEPTEQEKSVLKKVLDQAARTGKDLAAYNISPDQEIVTWKPVGCEKCGGRGYKGRLGVFEAILNDNALQQILEKHPSEREVKKVAVHQGILSMKEDGVLKILAGITSVEEVVKVVDLEEDLDLFENEEMRKMDEISPARTVEGVENHDSAPHDYYNEDEAMLASEDSAVQDEVRLLVDYLQMLEQEQARHPHLGIAKQIRSVQQTILSLLKKNRTSLFEHKTKTEQERVHEEVDLLMQELKKIEHHQSIQPDVGVADALQGIRSSLQNLSLGL
ncbi:MAG: GspE/PulE family protein [Candidatus Pacebacteria bacterium]|nr:GspE/PulE family protein [Candidatus Paceibacterota bacterium]MCD8508318.1 GspE/PulE family protein [Candidatus Paceibacterota bacterium]MCD8528012.1 GspE/PulE family protein [Candidatus Paceibacterota bacterium]MCD8563907.1 GspE/PulE family protein [Candidatus Paceibacterota bacterium]